MWYCKYKYLQLFIINKMATINENWCDITSSDSDARIKKIETYVNSLEERVKHLEKIVEEHDTKRNIENKNMTDHLKDMSTENLKMMNRMLEAEISLERTKNLLVRNNIPFSFRNNLSTILSSNITK
jgi:predicted RNase H-like nuclease (RuvC/YqgF family)